MANIPGATNVLPGVFTSVETDARGLAVAAGNRVTAIIGEGVTSEVLVSSATGGGKDGFNPDYSATTGSEVDGRHFVLNQSLVPGGGFVVNRTTVFRNGFPLNGQEGKIDGSSIPAMYDYRIDSTTGRIEMQSASILDVGGDQFKTLSNVGNGTITSLSLVDSNAPQETWNIRCVSVKRDGNGDPIDGYAQFIAVGSVSGNIVDANGNPYVWVSDGYVVTNNIIEFGIVEGTTPFAEGDGFSLQIQSGVLVKNDSLTATYIPYSYLNDPVLLQGLQEVVARHGRPSVDNNLSLGAQLAFANASPSVVTVQAAPSIPTRRSYTLNEGLPIYSSTDYTKYIFSLPVGVNPQADMNIHFFVSNPASPTVEKQVLPNKIEFGTIDTLSQLEEFTQSTASVVTGGFANCYTVIKNYGNAAVVINGKDGVLTYSVGDGYVFSSATSSFTDENEDMTLEIENAPASPVKFNIDSITGNKLYLTLISPVTIDPSTNLQFRVLDSGVDDYYVVINKLVVPSGYKLRVNVVDTKDADFYDTGWINALESLEKVEIDILVPLPKQTISTIFQNALNHCKSMSTIRNRKERVLFIGAISGLGVPNLIGSASDGTNKPVAVEDIGILEGIQGDVALYGSNEDLANYSVSDAFGNTYRCVYFYPDQIVVASAGENVLIDGFYIAAAAAGYLSSNPRVEYPLTNRVLSGFSILRNKQLTTLQLESLASSGVCTLQPVTGGGRVVWGITTSQSGFAEEQEISIVFIRDRIAKSLRASFAGFIGLPESDNTASVLSGTAINVLNSFISQNLITKFANLSVARDSVDPRQWNVSVKVQPNYPVNWIYIKVGVGTI